MNNVQTFSQDSNQYAKSRPQYPAELFAWLSGLVEHHDHAWDCATGNGQAAVALAEYFAQVTATDVSAEQVTHGMAHERVRYEVSPAEHTPFADESFDLVTVATAVHWFNTDVFYNEVRRVLKPNGVLAVWTYGMFEIEPVVDEFITEHLRTPIDRFWAEGNRMVMNGYRDLHLPFAAIEPVPTFAIEVEWSLEQLVAYARTWSAVKRFEAEVGHDPLEGLGEKLQAVWGEGMKVVRMPLFVKAERKVVR